MSYTVEKVIVFITTILTLGSACGGQSRETKNMIDGADRLSRTLFFPHNNEEVARINPNWFKKRELFLPYDQSDWMFFLSKEESGATITKVVLTGFELLNDGERINEIEITSEEGIKLLLPHGVRPFVSDIGVSGNESVGPITRANLGSLEYFFSDRDNFRVGITNSGFVMGYDIGTKRQTFWSRRLADQVARILPANVACKFLERWHARLCPTYFDDAQPDIVFSQGLPGVSHNRVIHPRNVNVPATLPLALPLEMNGESRLLFPANEYREGHFFGWMSCLEDYRAESLGSASAAKGTEYYLEGFKAGYEQCHHLLKGLKLKREVLVIEIDRLQEYYGEAVKN